MRNVTGDEDLIQEIQDAKPGDPSIYVNIERLSEMPEEFEAAILKVPFDIPKDKDNTGSFSWVGGKFMPDTALMYRIAEARGISGENGIDKPIYEEIDINIMMMKPIDAAPNYQRRLVGYSCSKVSTVLEEDGSFRKSSVCEIMYNAWNRCVENWTKYPDEKKYSSPELRFSNFQFELKFAQTKAETKAHCKTIRELAGLKTGYTIDELKKGYFVFAKIRKSKKMVKAEAAARLAFLSTGGTIPQMISAPAQPVVEQREEEESFSPPPPPAKEPEFIQDDTKMSEGPLWSRMVNALKFYQTEELISNTSLESKGTKVPLKDVVVQLISWLDREKEKAESHSYWKTAIDRLKLVESSIEADRRYRHGIEY